jgi:hypothetical protein
MQYVNNLTLANLEPVMNAHVSTNSSPWFSSASPYSLYSVMKNFATEVIRFKKSTKSLDGPLEVSGF